MLRPNFSEKFVFWNVSTKIKHFRLHCRARRQWRRCRQFTQGGQMFCRHKRSFFLWFLSHTLKRFSPPKKGVNCVGLFVFAIIRAAGKKIIFPQNRKNALKSCSKDQTAVSIHSLWHQFKFKKKIALLPIRKIAKKT